MRQAFVDGALGRHDVQPLSRAWWRKAAWTADRLGLANREQALAYHHRLHLAAMANPAREFEPHWEQAVARQSEVWQTLHPWQTPDESATTIRGGIAAWTAAWGDPDSPQTKAAINRTIEHLRRRQQDAVRRPRRTPQTGRARRGRI